LCLGEFAIPLSLVLGFRRSGVFFFLYCRSFRGFALRHWDADHGFSPLYRCPTPWTFCRNLLTPRDLSLHWSPFCRRALQARKYSFRLFLIMLVAFSPWCFRLVMPFKIGDVLGFFRSLPLVRLSLVSAFPFLSQADKSPTPPDGGTGYRPNSPGRPVYCPISF